MFGKNRPLYTANVTFCRANAMRFFRCERSLALTGCPAQQLGRKMPHRCGCHRQRGALLQHHSRFPSPQSAGRAAWILQSRLFPNWGGGFEHDAGTWFKVIPLATSKTAQQPRKAPSCSSLSQAWTGNRRVAFLCFRKFPLFECPAVIGLFFSRHVDILKL